MKMQATKIESSSLCPSDDKPKLKPPMTKQNTDYLFARQLSEEMESTIVRIQPGSRGSRASNYDNASRHSSEAFRNFNESNKQLLYFGGNTDTFCVNPDKSYQGISPIGEHITDEEESSRFASNFGTSKLKDVSPNLKTFKDAVENHCQNEPPVILPSPFG